MTNFTREIFDFAQLEPDCGDDIREMIAECNPAELAYIEKVCKTILQQMRMDEPNLDEPELI